MKILDSFPFDVEIEPGITIPVWANVTDWNEGYYDVDFYLSWKERGDESPVLMNGFIPHKEWERIYYWLMGSK
jgi:hypothetical protein